MYRSLIVNTVISAVAYFAISVVGLVIVSWLVGAYGLTAYGLITLARLFLPTGLAGIMDLGAPENASHTVATARSTGDWRSAGATLAALTVIVGLAALPLCAMLLFSAPIIAMWFDLSGADVTLFANTLQCAALSLPFLLVGLIAEGTIRGFERYGVARSIEVGVTLAYGIGCYVLIREGFSHAFIIYLGLALACARAFIAMIICAQCLKATTITFAAWRSIGLPNAWLRTRVTAPNKILSTFQTQSPPLLIGIFLGPANAAIYDVLTRLPRFAKSALGLLNSAVLPFTSRLEAAEKNVTRVAENGMLWIGVLSAPPLFAAATFSQPLLGLWIGKELTNFWVWQSFAFIMPLLTVLLSFGLNSLFGRIHVGKAMNYFIVVRIGVQYLVAFTCISMLSERAFILGGIVALATTAFWEFRIIFREHKINHLVTRQLLLLSCIGITLTIIVLPFSAMVHSIFILCISMVSYVLLFWGLAWVLVIPAHTKKALIKHHF